MGIVLLFLGVAVFPGIRFSVIRAAVNDDLVEVTTQACGGQGYGNTTVKLTREQYQHLQQYLYELNARLNKTATRQDAVHLFKEAVIELNMYRLLPQGMSVEQAQRLVSGGDLPIRLLQIVERMFRGSAINDSTNVFCLVAGYSNATMIYTLFHYLLLSGGYLISRLLYQLPVLLYLWMMIILLGITMLFFGIGYLLPFALWSDIYLYGGTGFLYTMGLGGCKKWVGTVHGKINGFTGIKILLDLKEPLEYFYLGSAVKVQTK